jgi:hypothetical protein
MHAQSDRAKELSTVTQNDTRERVRSEDQEREPKTLWGYSLLAAAICLGTGATIALIAILGG